MVRFSLRISLFITLENKLCRAEVFLKPSIKGFEKPPSSDAGEPDPEEILGRKPKWKGKT